MAEVLESTCRQDGVQAAFRFPRSTGRARGCRQSTDVSLVTCDVSPPGLCLEQRKNWEPAAWGFLAPPPALPPLLCSPPLSSEWPPRPPGTAGRSCFPTVPLGQRLVPAHTALGGVGAECVTAAALSSSHSVPLPPVWPRADPWPLQTVHLPSAPNRTLWPGLGLRSRRRAPSCDLPTGAFPAFVASPHPSWGPEVLPGTQLQAVGRSPGTTLPSGTHPAAIFICCCLICSIVWGQNQRHNFANTSPDGDLRPMELPARQAVEPEILFPVKSLFSFAGT